MIWLQLDPRVSIEAAVGFLPDFLSNDDPRPAVEQLDENYCGGWMDSKVGERGFTAFDDFMKLHWPGDPPLHALAVTMLHAGEAKPERIVVYESAYVAVIQADGTFRVARLD